MFENDLSLLQFIFLKQTKQIYFYKFRKEKPKYVKNNINILNNN
jgi:hypothetical protein